jgi:hypothetical protein
VVRVSGDASVAGQLRKTADGRVELHFPERLVMIANHQVICLHGIVNCANSYSYTLTGSTSGGRPTPISLKCMVIYTSS